MKEEKIENISEAFHGENFGICDFFSAFRTLRDQGSCKNSLSSLVLGDNQLHSIAVALCSTIHPAYLGTRHLGMTTGKESMPLFTLPLHMEKNIRPGNCKISEAPMRSLLPGSHPQTSFKERYTPAHRGGAGLWNLTLRSVYSLCLGPRKEEIQGRQFIWQSRELCDATFSALSQIA